MAKLATSLRFLGSATLMAATLCLALPAGGQAIVPGEEGELKAFAPPRDGARACFSRVYDAAHLQKHPRQRVTEMHFRIAYHVFEPDEFFPKGQRNYYFQLDARLRGQSRKLTTGGECQSSDDKKAIFCYVECDGGGVQVSKRKPDQILVDLEASGRLRMTLGCDESEENAIDLEPGADDKNFLLNATPAASCPAYEDW